jgi:hypothetical protein
LSRTAESDTANTESNPPTTSPFVAIESIPLEAFTLRIVVPAKTRRLQQIAAPFDRDLLLSITQTHIHNFLESELHRNVEQVTLEYVEPSQVASLQGSTVVFVCIHGLVLMGGAPSAKVLNALAMQSLEGQALWEFFFQLRESDDAALSSTQQVTLVDQSTTTSTTSEKGLSGLVIGILAATSILTTGIIVYMFVWAKRSGAHEEDKRSGTPDTNASSQFFPETTSDIGAVLGSTITSSIYTRNDDALSVNSGHNSFVSSALHSIQELSLEEDEEEDEEKPPDFRQWGDTMSEIHFHQDIVDITPNSMHVDESVDVQTTDYLHEGRIKRIMRVEPSVYTTDQGTEAVSRRKVPARRGPQKKKKATANKWKKWSAPKRSITEEFSV